MFIVGSRKNNSFKAEKLRSLKFVHLSPKYNIRRGKDDKLVSADNKGAAVTITMSVLSMRSVTYFDSAAVKLSRHFAIVSDSAGFGSENGF